MDLRLDFISELPDLLLLKLFLIEEAALNLFAAFDDNCFSNLAGLSSFPKETSRAHESHSSIQDWHYSLHKSPAHSTAPQSYLLGSTFTELSR